MCSARSQFLYLLGVALLLLGACGAPDNPTSTLAYPAPVGTSEAYFPPITHTATPWQPDPPTETPGPRRTLIGASSAEVAALAQEIAVGQFPTQGTPTVVVNRRVLATDLPKLGLESSPGMLDLPLRLVILRGDFDITTWQRAPAGSEHIIAHYVMYLFNLCSVAPMTIAPSVDGRGLMTAIDNPANVPEPTAPLDPALCAGYGTPAPPIALPTTTP